MATIPRYSGPFGTPRPSVSSGAPASDLAAARQRASPGSAWTAPSTRSRTRRASGGSARAPHDDKGRPLAPADAWGHDHLWWLDRMVRTRRPLVERMTLVWHDWFATSNAGVGSQKLMLAQNRLLRRNALGRFDRLLVEITANPAMLLWLSGTDNRKGAPNENYGRELMELFTLGEGNGYTERDVREQARALTGWTSTWTREQGPDQLPLRSDAARPGRRRPCSASGATSPGGTRSRSASTTRSTPPFFVDKLWSYFVPVPPDAKTRAGLVEIYERRLRGAPRARGDPPASRRSTPARAWSSPPSSTSPGSCAGSAAGSTRRRGSGSPRGPASASSTRPTWPAGTTRAGSTRTRSTAAGAIANTALEKVSIGDRKGKKAPKVPNDPEAIVKGALAVLGNPTIRPETRRELLAFARGSLKSATGWKAEAYPPLVANAVRQLLAVSPDLQTC